jgi:hypothetical protein
LQVKGDNWLSGSFRSDWAKSYARISVKENDKVVPLYKMHANMIPKAGGIVALYLLKKNKIINECFSPILFLLSLRQRERSEWAYNRECGSKPTNKYGTGTINIKTTKTGMNTCTCHD